MRTDAGHSTPKDSNAFFRRDLAEGQTRVSVALDSSLGDVRALLDGIPLAGTKASTTIDAPATWLLALALQALPAQLGSEAAATPAGGPPGEIGR